MNMFENLGPSVKIQKVIKENSLEVQDYIADLHKWEKDVKEKEILGNQGKSFEKDIVKDLPPIRCKKSEGSAGKIVTDNRKIREIIKPKKKDGRISSYDYASWDKFDVDKALESSSSDTGGESPSNTVEPSNFRESSGSSKIMPSVNQKDRAIKLKDEGNKHYSNNRLEDAIAKYTQGIALDPTNPILPANRAMAYIKLQKYEAAELDCNRCIRLDSNYIKAYLRRGTSRLKLGKIESAAEDFSKVLELEPWNKDAKKELETIGKHKRESVIREITDLEKEWSQNTKTSIIVESPSDNLSPKSDKHFINTNQSEAVTPIVKLTHQRSQNPLKTLNILDVLSEESLPKELPSCLSSNNSKVKNISNMDPNNAEVLKNSQREDIVTCENTQNDTDIPAVILPLIPPVPRTSHQFTKDWQRLSKHQIQAIKYLKAIPPSFFQDVDIDTEVFVDFVSALRWDGFSPEDVSSYLGALTKSDGFDVNLMFLDHKQKKDFWEVIEKCKDQKILHNLLTSKFQ